MSLLKVEPSGLQALATHCGGWSTDVAVTTAPSAPSVSAQATAAAVGAVHTVTSATGGVLSGRMSASGGHLGTTALEFAAQDARGTQDLEGVHKESAASIILGAMAGGPPGGGAVGGPTTSGGLSVSLLPDKTDWILGGAGATGQLFADKVAELTRNGLATSGDGASPVLRNAVSELKGPVALFSKEAPILGSKMGGGVGAVLSIPAIARDVGEGKMSAGQAIAREGVGVVAGMAAGGFVAPVVGPLGGAAVGVVAGGLASKAVDVAWEPLVEFGESAADGGYKVARLGRL